MSELMNFGSAERESEREEVEEPLMPNENEKAVPRQQPQVVYVQKKGHGCLIAAVVVVVLVVVMAMSGRSANRDRMERNQAMSEQASQNATPVDGGSNDATGNADGASATSPAQTESEAQSEVQEEPAEFEVSIEDARFGSSGLTDSPCIIVTYSYTNNSLDGASMSSFMWNVKDKVYQNGTELQETYVADLENDNATRDIKPGTTVEVTKGYKLIDETADVDVELYTSGLRPELITAHTFSIA